MSALIENAIHKLLITICMMWLFETRGKINALESEWMVLFFYARDFDFKDPRLDGKRILVEFQIEEWKE